MCQDSEKGSIASPSTQNLYKYCLNNPNRYIDPAGRCEEEIDYESIELIVQNAIMNNSYGFVIDGLNISLSSLGTFLKKAILEDVRPNQIGVGTWKKLISAQLDDAARIFGSSADDVLRGFANSRVTGLFPKVLDKLGYLGAVIDTVSGVKTNIEEGASWENTASDAIVDVAVSGGTIWAAGTAGAAIGGAAGTIVPGAGNIVGAIGGFLVGIGGYVITDVIEVDGKSIRDNIKDGISNFFGFK